MTSRILAHFGVRHSMLDVRCFHSVQGCQRGNFHFGEFASLEPALRPPPRSRPRPRFVLLVSRTRTRTRTRRIGFLAPTHIQFGEVFPTREPASFPKPVRLIRTKPAPLRCRAGSAPAMRRAKGTSL